MEEAKTYEWKSKLLNQEVFLWVTLLKLTRHRRLFEFSQRQMKIHQFFLFFSLYFALLTNLFEHVVGKKQTFENIHTVSYRYELHMNLFCKALVTRVLCICNNFKQTDQGWPHHSMGKSACLKLFSIWNLVFFSTAKMFTKKIVLLVRFVHRNQRNRRRKHQLRGSSVALVEYFLHNFLYCDLNVCWF